MMMPQADPTSRDEGAQGQPRGGEAVTIETRFGTFTFDETNTVFLPQGVIGFPQFRRFGLTEMPDPRMAQFKLLQCLEQPDLSFLVLPLALDGQTIAAQDMDDALETLAIAREDAEAMLIVTLRKEEAGVSISTNLRAPILLDIKAKVGRQYVLPNPEYPIRHVLKAAG